MKNLTFATSVDARRQADMTALLAAHERGAQPHARNVSVYPTRIVGETANGPMLRFVLFTEGRKRDGDAFMVDGADLTQIRANGRIPWAHKYDRIPVGNWVRIEKMTDPRLGRIIEADAIPLRIDDGSEAAELSKTLFRMYAVRDLEAVSGGWLPTELSPITDEDGRMLGLRHVKSDVLEGSMVPIGADPQALQRSIQAGRLPEKFVSRFVRGANDIYTIRDMPDETSAPEPVLSPEARGLLSEMMRELAAAPRKTDAELRAEAEAAVLAEAEATRVTAEAEAAEVPAIPEARTVDAILAEIRAALPGLIAEELAAQKQGRAGAVLAKRNRDKLAEAAAHAQGCADAIRAVLDDADTPESPTGERGQGSPAAPAPTDPTAPEFESRLVALQGELSTRRREVVSTAADQLAGVLASIRAARPGVASR